jgi:quercetin dioxygenase-like cupin family protein
MKRFATLGALLALAVSAGTALATPPVGVTATVLARGTNQTAQLLSAGPSRDIVTVQLTLAPGATTGWHTHPGATTAVVTSGVLSYWRTPDCIKRTLVAGDSVRLSNAVISPGGGTGLDLARNEGTAPVTVMVTAVNIPVGSNELLQSVSSTPCTSAPQEFAMSAGISVLGIARGTLGIALNVDVAANTDILNQTITIAPGGSTGWHGHPGTTMVVVSAGTGTFVRADCTTVAQPTGSAFLDTPGTQHNFRNDGTVPLIIHATYVNVPVAGVFRLDRDAPACAGTAAAAATPAPAALPNTAAGGDAAFSLLSVLATAIVLSSGAGFALGWAARRRRLG